MMTRKVGICAAVCMGFAVLVAAVTGRASERVEARLQDREGNAVGSVILVETPRGTLVQARFLDLPPGTHAMHIHAVGACTPSFAAAGGHLNPSGRDHGFLEADGPHAGDLPNIHVPVTRRLTVEAFSARIEVDEMLLDGDGAAVVIHRGADDYRTNPAGDAGTRIACGVIGN